MSKTIVGSAQGIIEVKRSKFIANLLHIDNETDGRDFVIAVKKKYYDARHNPYAYITDERQKSNDDGEPTAGMPILQTLQKADLTNVAAVVTRYFGGIKLGASGLGRAYANAVTEALGTAQFAATKIFRRVSVTCDYPLYDALDRHLRQKNIRMEDTSYADKVRVTVLLPPDKVTEEIAALVDMTNAAVECEILDEVTLTVPC